MTERLKTRDAKEDGRYYSGEKCPKSGTYGQWSDASGQYAGTSYDRYVYAGDPFPPSLNNHHFRLK